MTSVTPVRVESRDQLIFLLAEACEIEHVLLCEYLFAGLSLKSADDEGLTPAQLAATRRWQGVIWEVAAQEMLHLALANNLLTAIGELYRVIEEGFRTLAARHGETDLASAQRAIEAIVEQGEGVRGDWQSAHYGRFLGVYHEFRAMTAAGPSFDPARPVQSNPASRMAPDSTGLTLIDDPFTIRVSDYFNAAYDLIVQMLARFFAHTEESDDDLATLVQAAIDGMFTVLLPLGELLTRLPMGPAHPGRTAGPAFGIYRQTADVLPHRRAAWLHFHERLTELAGFGDRLQAEHPTAGQLAAAADGLRAMAARLDAALTEAERDRPSA